jgi:hypothetical protein
MEMLQQFEFDENNKIQGDYISKFKEEFKGKQMGSALKFASFVIKDAENIGKDEALAIKTPFDEKAVIESNRAFVFENFPIKNRTIHMQSDAVEGPNAESIKEGAVPGKPGIMFF